MNIALRTLLRTGSSSSLVEDFRALAEATAPSGQPRYRERPVLEDLARFIARGGNGPNRDTPFYELCHLVNAVDAAGAQRDRRNAFFLEPEVALPSTFRLRLDRALAGGGWRRAGFHRAAEGIAIQYPDGAFTIRFSRMPFLAALYEFLVGMDDFAFYPELEAIFDGLMSQPASMKAIQATSNRIAAAFRQYRRRSLAHVPYEAKFDLLFEFLAARSHDRLLTIDDDAVLDFWLQKSTSSDFRAYRTVFEAFATLLRALDECAHAEALLQAAPIGLDRENGEIEPDDSLLGIEDATEWTSPLFLLDEEPAASIKFLKKESERRPLECVMHYGPVALRLPLALLRLESFAPVQSAITTDLQIKRGGHHTRLDCADALSYGEVVARFEALLALLARLQKAVFYALHRASRHGNRRSDAGASEAGTEMPIQPDDMLGTGGELVRRQSLEELAAEAAKVFRSIARKGFDEAGLSDAARVRGFEIGAGALTSAASHLAAYIAAVRGMRGSLDQKFELDRSVFRERFHILYGVTQ